MVERRPTSGAPITQSPYRPGRAPSPKRCEALYDRLMELDDVDAVYTNAEGLSN